ncbi:MAG: hypothetical protein IKO68_00130 [Oscillospiraceae bacterium]|nr:hypothetical protein [Oscillospiraceae bacterium]MBR4655002.1 hypothetical protein [Oscillospiraceae bacterium]
MLTPEYLASLPEPILRLWEEAEREILRDMARRISTYDYWIPAADYQAERLIAAGHTRNEILAVLAKITKKTEKELRQMMTEAGSRCLREDAAVYQAAGLKTPLIRESKALTEILNSGFKHTLGTMQNITRTTARTATRQFENALDLAWSQVSSGAFDAGSAIRQAVKQLCQQGVEAVEYPSGKVDTVETAVRRAVLTGINQTAAKLQEELADEVGCDLVEVSAHAGARPEHAEWQGKIYSRSGKSEKYPDFRSSTGYGTGAGLCGWNCRHTFGPYIEGSPRIWTDEKLEELSAPKYEYQGEKFTEYEARQKEKYFDRQITRWRREAEAMKAAGQDPAEAQAKVKAWERRKSDFVLNRREMHFSEPCEDVIAEYFAKATPGIGELIIPPGYDMGPNHERERKTAEWLLNTFGGEIIVKKEENTNHKKTADYLWDGKLWDLKNPTTEKAANSLVRHGVSQIQENPGGVILDYEDIDFNMDQLRTVLDKRMQWVHGITVDIMVVGKGTAQAVYRYKK